MLCEICNEREANVVFTEVVNGKVTEHNLCMECARNSDFGQQNYAAFFDGESHLGRLLSGLLGMALNNNGESVENDGQNVVCPVCKTSYKDFVNRSRFGCADCYDVFELLMEDHIKNLQGNTTHVGKRPMKAKSRIETASKQMNNISAEDKALLQELFGETAATQQQADKENASGGHDPSDFKEAAAAVNIAAAENTGSAITGNAGPAAVAARTREQIDVMKKQLQKALEEENYKSAAHLRDQIHALEDSLKEDSVLKGAASENIVPGNAMSENIMPGNAVSENTASGNAMSENIVTGNAVPENTASENSPQGNSPEEGGAS